MLTAGAARVEITPPLSIPYLGYAPRHAFFEGVHDPLFARALVVDDGERRAALVTADSIGFRRSLLGEGRDFTAEFRERVRRLTGIPPEAVMLCATHAHSTPETIGLRPLREHPGAVAWLETLLDQLATSVALADRVRAPAVLKRGALPVEGVAHCRRIRGKDGRLYPYSKRPPDAEIASWGVTDPELAVLLFGRGDGSPGIVLVHFACHPVTMQVQPLVSADFPGALTALVERAVPGCVQCLFLQGAAGSINPVRDDTRDWADVHRYGLTLAGATLQLLGRMAAPEYPVDPARVAFARAEVTLPSRPLPPVEPLEEALAAARARAAATADAGERQRLARAVLAPEEQFLRARMGDAPLTAEVQALRLGDTAFVGIPGEPFCEMGLAIKGWGPLKALCAGYANDWLGYFAPPTAWEEGGYEVSLGTWSLAGPEACGLLLAAGRQVYQTLG
jgi:hypothetical protein